MYKQLFPALLVVVLLVHAAKTANAGFSYVNGGQDWDGLCRQPQTLQSPIDIRVKGENLGADGKELDIFYPVINAWRAGLAIENTGADLVIAPHEPFTMGYIFHAQKKYYVQKVSFKAPAEHRINGEEFPLEMQIRHQRSGKTGDDEVIMLSILFRLSNDSNPFLDLQMKFNQLPNAPGSRTVLTDFLHLGSGLFGLHSGYYAYQGSLTQPPCSTGVYWIVLENIQEVSMIQLNHINRLFKNNIPFAGGHGNNRQLQDSMNRPVLLHNHRPRADGDGRPIPIPVYNPEIDDTTYESAYDQTPLPEALNPQSSQKSPQRVPASNTTNSSAIAENSTSSSSTSSTSTIKATGPVPKLYAKNGDDWTGYCASEHIQSPIDIRLGYGNPHGNYLMSVKYRPENVSSIMNAGFAFVVQSYLGSMLVESNENGFEKFTAIELRFHSPSEHKIDGRQYDMEMEIIHVAPSVVVGKQKTAILSVLFHATPTGFNPFLQSLQFRALPPGLADKTYFNEFINLASIAGIHGSYYSYSGSLSVPPCTPGVKRFVLRTISEMSTLQLSQIKKYIDGNNRRVQATGSRGVMVHKANDALNGVEKLRTFSPYLKS